MTNKKNMNTCYKSLTRTPRLLYCYKTLIVTLYTSHIKPVKQSASYTWGCEFSLGLTSHLGNPL